MSEHEINVCKVSLAKRQSINRWRDKNKDLVNSYSRAWAKRNWLYLKAKKHGLTEEKFLAIYEKQNGKCPVCGFPLGQGRDLTVDHDHTCCKGSYSCGKCVRGLLHGTCNSLLGLAHENPELLAAAGRYLRGNANIPPIVIGKRFTFDAAHRLPLHGGKCQRPHGHTYTLEVDICGRLVTETKSDMNMVMDYYLLKEAVDQEIMQRFDHRDLNQAIKPFDMRDPEKENVTTAENLSGIFARLLSARLNSSRGIVSRVRLCETPTSWAEWHVGRVDCADGIEVNF